MTDLTDDQVRALLDGARQPLDDLSRNPSRKGQHDLMNAAPDLARALLQARAELAAANAREAGLRKALMRWKDARQNVDTIEKWYSLANAESGLVAALAQPSTEVATKPDLCNKNGREGDQT